MTATSCVGCEHDIDRHVIPGAPGTDCIELVDGEYCSCPAYEPPDLVDPLVIDAAHLSRQRDFSVRTFGPGRRTRGVIEHIRKELVEVEADPTDITEWVDVVILALDGALRHGAEPQQIIDAIHAKQARNEARTWPDWRLASEDHAIEHDRSTEATP